MITIILDLDKTSVDDLHAMYQWCKEHCEGEVEWAPDTPNFFSFESGMEAMHFKLRWADFLPNG